MCGGPVPQHVPRMHPQRCTMYASSEMHCVCTVCASSERLPGLPASLWHCFQGTPKQEGGGGDERPLLLNLKEYLRLRSSLGMEIRQP